jgi:hypothetical protein
MKRLIPVLSLCFIVTACAQLGWNPKNQVDATASDIKKRLRSPGETLITHPNDLATAPECATRKAPAVTLNSNEVVPETVYPGNELNHHFTYTLCPSKNADVIKGNLYRRLYYQGKVELENVAEGFEFKPGKWSVDEFIELPVTATEGVYSFQMTFTSKSLKIEDSRYLVVKKP